MKTMEATLILTILTPGVFFERGEVVCVYLLHGCASVDASRIGSLNVCLFTRGQHVNSWHEHVNVSRKHSSRLHSSTSLPPIASHR
jgi:hypothetical protein